MRSDGTERRAILDQSDGAARHFRFSPDGQKVAYGLSTGEPGQAETTVWIVSRDGQDRTRVPLKLEPGTTAPPSGLPTALAWPLPFPKPA